MALPLLPGYSFNTNLGKEKFHKSQHFDISNGTPMMVGEEKPGIGGELLPGQTIRPKFSVYPKGDGSALPSWVAFDKQVLCFDAYFTESVPESREELSRVRYCRIYFYLEDDTIQVVEPEIQNSGIPQGTLIRRHRIPLPPPNDDQFYTVECFNLNIKVEFYSRAFNIINCDQFTSNFLRKLGVRLNSPVFPPGDSYNSIRQQMKDSMQPLRPLERIDTLKQFLEHDREVLQFFCHWDDTDEMFGDSRELILHYFLADDTVEVREVIKPNSGRDSGPVFLHRSKLPKPSSMRMLKPGEKTARTVLNVFGPMGQGGRHILDSLKTGAVYEEFYKDSDFIIGATINVWGRKIIICDCDAFTQEHYRTKFGIDNFTPFTFKQSVTRKVEREIPPYNGFGSEEDSLCSCQGLLPKPPQKDFKKMMEKDRQGLESNVLRFVGRLVTDSPIDVERIFIISYFLSDDTISVFEPPQTNSGVIGGKFLERNRIKKPDQELFKSELSEYFKAEDLYVGARVCFYGQNFQLMNADEYTFNYMERHPDEFPKADIATIISKLKNIAEPKLKDIRISFVRNDPSNTGTILYGPFRNLLAEVAEGQLSEHEIMTVGRHYSSREQPEIDMKILLTMAQEQLRRKSFEDFPRLLNYFIHKDKTRKGMLPTEECRTICKAFKLPVADDLLRAILTKFESEDKQLDYNVFLSEINWRDNPLPFYQSEKPVKFVPDWNGESSPHAVISISYKILIEDVFGKQD
ncbi:EF-hand domain-containing family member C2 [Erpetoichthys calabaricus]|uniref:EF-hand domain-containing family member C2 n=1 Tax=Erpetoichthys calabaricus TaxID=27687 RepID=A0A8C4SG47_ERPCA|nr:EF-hand domain-containing family member C2 [Erpetoichthys calabaricus]